MFIERLFARWMDALERDKRVLRICNPSSSEPHMKRGFPLFWAKDRASSLAPFNVYLHEFLDDDWKVMHDHPWGFFVLILSGGYCEVTPGKAVWYPPGTILFRPADFLHRIELDKSSSARVFTLVIRGPRTRDWGFMKDGRWQEAKAVIQQYAL